MTAQPEQEPTGAPQPDPVPRDMPDQQARSDDPLDLPGDRPADGPTDRPANENPGGRPDEADRDDGDGLPDTDEAGTGPRGAPRAATVHPEHPGPDESPD
ncbi:MULTISPECIES: hypothetical protein [unclassified Streptomyces]|uniref:hypothetical protein n=1 Tax=unclassified Streptomyces TaxID=2593676 RepID=UPI000DB9BF9E|nr:MULTISPECIES: hypothetical protein [unclassified Streptomyces]MYU05970.1 hypothetical protein [Streptomyces sp. SID8366]MYU65402.1 hypothetical protein [Streptomyces sp. SID69]RAJ64029.1 hypothetical protein K376_01125 [Streptomyces sp. PsTaAH-130]